MTDQTTSIDTPTSVDLDRIVSSASRMGVELDEIEALQWLTAVALAKESTDVVVDLRRRRVRTSGHHAGLQLGGPGLLPPGRPAWSSSRPTTMTSRRHWRSRGRPPSRRCRPIRAIATTSSGSTSRPDTGRRPVVRLGEVDAQQGAGHPGRRHLPAHRGQVRQLPHRRDARTADLMPQGQRRLPGRRRGSEEPALRSRRARTATPSRSPGRQACRRSRLVQARLGGRRPGSGPGRQRQQHARRHLGGTGRFDHTPRRLPRPVLPGGLPGGGFDAAVHQAGEPTSRPTLSTNMSKPSSTRCTSTWPSEPKNYGKAAKRMYNIFRLNGSYEEAAYLRELFDEPTAVLYQVGAVVRTLDEASQPGSAITAPHFAGSARRSHPRRRQDTGRRGGVRGGEGAPLAPRRHHRRR